MKILMVLTSHGVLADPMNSEEPSCNWTYADDMHIAERELSSFIRAVRQLFGPEQAELSTKDWLEESELTDCPPLSTSRNWRAVTIAAAARLANHLATAQHRGSDRLVREGFVRSSCEGVVARRAG